MTTNKQHNYDEDKIKSLSSLEHIRKRTGMYIGRVGDGSDYDDGIYILLKEVVDNAVDEFIMGYGERVVVTVDAEGVTVRDYGRGIPLGKVVECVSRINTGAKYSDEVFQFSVGLNGIGTKAVNALSERFLVRSFRDGEFAGARFERGRLQKEEKGRLADERDGTFVSFAPDPEIFGAVAFNADHVVRRLRLYSFLNAGLRIEYNGTVFVSRDGLLDLLRDEVGDEALYAPLHHRSRTIELAFTHTQRFDETFLSFVNGQYTSGRRRPPERVPRGPRQGLQRILEGQVRGRRHPRRDGRCHRRPAEGAGFRVADQEQARQHGAARRTGRAGAGDRRRPAAPQPEGRREGARQDRGNGEAPQGAAVHQEDGPRAGPGDLDPRAAAEGLQGPFRQAHRWRSPSR